MSFRPKDTLTTLLAVVYALPALAYPFGNDQGLHWYIGKRWLEGELPFVSAISSKPIGMFVVHALSTLLMGSGQWPIRVSEILTVVLTGYLAALAATPGRERPRDGELGLGALMFSVLYYSFFDYWDTAHPELWEGGFAVAGLVVAARAERSFVRDAGACALCTASFMFKYPAALPALVILAMCVRRSAAERLADEPLVKVLGRTLLHFLAGAVPVVFLAVIPFVIGGKLGPMWEILYDFILHYRDQARPGPGLPVWLRIETGGGLPLLAFLAGSVGVAFALGRRERTWAERGVWLMATMAAALASVFIQARFYGYHWVVSAPFAAALCVYVLRTVRLETRGVSWPMIAFAVCFLGVLSAVGPRWKDKNTSYAKHALLLLDYLNGEIKRDAYLAHYNHARLENPAPLERVTAILMANAKPNDTLCARGFVAPLHQMTGMRCTSRHIVEEIVHRGLPTWAAEYRQALRDKPPTFIVTFSNRQADIRSLVRQGYHSLGGTGLFVVYSLRPPTTVGAAAPR